jgi:TP901 family phage tail tape measure protein
MPAVASIALSVKAQTSSFLRGLRRAERALKQFSRRVRAAAQTVKRISIGIAAFGVAAAFAFQRITRAGEAFNQKMNRSLAILSGVSDELRATMKRTALEIARVTTHSAQQAAESYFFLASAGLSVKQSIAALPTVAKFAQAGMFDMARATDLLTDAQSALGLTMTDTARNMKNMRRVADVLVKANTLANASVEQFSESLTTKAGAALKVLKKDIEEGVAVLAAFADQGIKGSDAGTALNIVLRDLSTKAIKNAKAFREHGIFVFDLAGKMRNLAHIVSDVERALAGMGDEAAKATLLQLGFSDKSVIFLQTLLGLSTRINAYEAGLRRAGGTMQRVADKQLTDMEKAVAKLKATWVAFSEALTPAVDAAAVLIDTLAEKLGDFTASLTPNAIVGWVEEGLNALERFATRFQSVTRRLGMFIDAVNRAGRPGSLVGDDIAGVMRSLLGPTSTPMPGAIPVPELGTRVRQAVEASAARRENRAAKERIRNIQDAVAGFFSKLKFEAERNAGRVGQILIDVMAGKLPLALMRAQFPGLGKAGIEKEAVKMEPQRRFAELRQISPTRFHIPGLAGYRGQEQLVRDPTVATKLDELIRLNRDPIVVAQ